MWSRRYSAGSRLVCARVLPPTARIPLMAFFAVSNWPLWVLSVAMVVAAVIDGWKLKVPNWLTFPLVLSGWALGGLHDLGWVEGAGTGSGGIVASLAGTGLGFALLFPVYAIGGMGAGDVKMQMGFGA